MASAGSVHGLQPHRLPDAAGGRVHNAAGIQSLFAARLAAVVLGTVDTNDQFVRSAVEIWRNVVTEGIIAALMDANLLPVHINCGLPIHSVQMQNDSLSIP